MTITIPYQNHSNKKLFDYALTCCNQLNNINCATNSSCAEAKENNYVYLVLTSSLQICLFVRLSHKDSKNNEYKSLTDIWIPLKDVKLDDINIVESYVYKFNIKKFHSLLSFASNYKDRNNIVLTVGADYSTIYYAIAETTINVDLAKLVDNSSYLYQNIKQSARKLNQKMYDSSSFSTPADLSVTNVDKNSFLLPYFNHKTCLNFSVALTENQTSFIINEDNKQYIINSLYDSDELQFYSKILLREDKFKLSLTATSLEVSPGIWQLLTILQGSKVWQHLHYFSADDYCTVNFSDDVVVYHLFDIELNLKKNVEDFTNYEVVGKLQSNEIFLLNKLFTNSKNSYFDFSKQKFIGTNYVFGDDPNEIQETDLVNQQESILPLKITFTELKNYIGSDLSQKDFVLIVKTNGINVMLEKWNKDETTLECVVAFNHTMSKKYLSL